MEIIELLLKNRYKIDAKFGELKTIYTEILEPYLKYTVQVPNDFCGRAMSDFKKMRASIVEVTAKGEDTTLTGKIPVDTSKSYQARQPILSVLR